MFTIGKDNASRGEYKESLLFLLFAFYETKLLPELWYIFRFCDIIQPEYACKAVGKYIRLCFLC
ncbi:MAG TPA: hypothetical protein DEQ30_07425, partial [Porphyromonadaceae bacterium]|nr:hypothetical protein [Porphyromonadaceae bacterium]